MARGFFRYVENDSDAQSVQDLEELAPLRGFAATLDLAQKILAYTYAASSIVLADTLSFADSAYYWTKAV